MPDTVAFLADPAPRAPAAPAPTPDGGAGLWDGDGFGFSDLLDLVNPLQHIPVLSTLYRAVTGDSIGGAARIAGGALFGGPVGMISALGGAGLEQRTGRDFGDTLLALAAGEKLSPAALAAAAPVEAPDSAPDAMPSLAEIARAPYAAPDLGVQLAAAAPVEAPDSAPDAMPASTEIARAPYASPDLGVRLAAAAPVEAPDSAPDAMPPLAEAMPAAYARLAAAAARTQATAAAPPPAEPARPTRADVTEPPGGPILPAAPAARGVAGDGPWAWLPRTAPVPPMPAPAGAVPAGKRAARAPAPETAPPSWFVQAMQGALDRYEASAGLAATPAPGRSTDLRR